MKTRTLPPADVFASCPLEGRLLEFYAGKFEAVYISLHPFIRPVMLSKEVFQPHTFPTRRAIAASCKPITWHEVARLAGLPSLEAVDIGLRTAISGLRTDLRNESYAEAISALSDTQNILPPPEGVFSDLVHDRILQSIQKLGYEWLWVGDEFCTERKLHWIEDLRHDDSLTRGRFNVFTPDKQLLWTVHWDSHFSFLCSSKQNLEAIQRLSELEGFFCTPKTEVYWSVNQENDDASDTLS